MDQDQQKNPQSTQQELYSNTVLEGWWGLLEYESPPPAIENIFEFVTLPESVKPSTDWFQESLQLSHDCDMAFFTHTPDPPELAELNVYTDKHGNPNLMSAVLQIAGMLHPEERDVETTAICLTFLHLRFKEAVRLDDSLKCPLIPLLKAYYEDRSAKRVDKAFDKKRPVAILRSGSLGSSRSVVLDMEGTAESLIVPRVNDQPKESQLVLFESDSDSVLPDILPFHQLWDGKSKKQTKGGAVSHGARVMGRGVFSIGAG